MVDPTYTGPAQYHLPGEDWTCSIRHQCIVKQLSAQIHAHVNGVPATKYWKTKFQLSDSQWHLIYWAGIGQTYQESSPATRHWVVKHTLGFFAHGKNMAQWQFQSSMKCPCCTTEIEDKAHIMQCPSKEATQTWSHSLKQLKKWFWESNMAHEIADAIIWGLNRWRNPEGNPPSAGTYLRDQETIGWDHFMDGWLVCSWQMHQEIIWHSTCSHQSSQWWVAELIKKVWNVSWDMWAHHNGILHNSLPAKNNILEKHANNHINKIYATGTQALLRDAFGLLHHPKEQTLQLLLTAKQQWLESVEIAMDRKKWHDYGQYPSEQQFMATWVICK